MTTKWMIHMGMLGICSMEDLREKKISLWKIRLYAAVVLIYEIGRQIGGTEKISEWLIFALTGLLPGIGMLIMGKLSKEAVGYGDGYLTLILGFSMGFWETLGVLGTAIYLVIIRKKSRDSQIAFVPFLLLGMAGAGLWSVR